MKHFLIVFDRPRREMAITEFEESQRDRALVERLAQERAHAGDSDFEVVLLSAPSRDILMRTHGRYFRTLAEMERQLSDIKAVG